MRNKRENSGAWKLFILLCVTLWVFIIVFSLYILKRGGHLKLLASQTIIAEGQVLDSGGKGIPNARVIVSKDNLNNYIFTDLQGKFAVRNGTEASYKVTIDADGYKQSSSTITFVEGNKSYYIYALDR